MDINMKLAQLEAETLRTTERLHSLKSSKSRVLILVNDTTKLDSALRWFHSHSLSFTDASVILRSAELTTPIVLKISDNPESVCPPFLHSLHQTLSASFPHLPVTLYAIPPLELTTTAVSLLHSQVDLVFIVGCQVLSRAQYENVAEFSPLVEEIILKEAIQPVILYK